MSSNPLGNQITIMYWLITSLPSLLTPPINRNGDLCAEFMYNMYGFHIGTLEVFTRDGFSADATQWSETGQRGSQWLQGRATLTNFRSGSRVSPIVYFICRWRPISQKGLGSIMVIMWLFLRKNVLKPQNEYFPIWIIFIWYIISVKNKCIHTENELADKHMHGEHVVIHQKLVR